MCPGRRWRVGLGLGLGLLAACRQEPVKPAEPRLVEEVVWTPELAAVALETARSDWERDDGAAECASIDGFRARLDSGSSVPRFVDEVALRSAEKACAEYRKSAELTAAALQRAREALGRATTRCEETWVQAVAAASLALAFQLNGETHDDSGSEAELLRRSAGYARGFEEAARRFQAGSCTLAPRRGSTRPSRSAVVPAMRSFVVLPIGGLLDRASEDEVLLAGLWDALRSLKDDDLRTWGSARAMEAGLPVPLDLQGALVANLQHTSIQLFTARAAAVASLIRAWPPVDAALLVEAGVEADSEPLLPPARADQPVPPPPWQLTIPIWLRHGSRD